MKTRDVILIIGAGRSGTSALARVLSLCGCALPETVSGAEPFNPRGSWEPIEILRLNLELFHRHGTGFGDPAMRLQERRPDEEEREQYITSVQQFLDRHAPGKRLVIKQPGVTDLLDLWREAAARGGHTLKIVIAVRHPTEVAASMSAFMRQPVSLECANAFWLKRNLLAEHTSRDLPRVFVEYRNLMSDWRKVVARISAAL
jgi:hypothetical protein